MFLIDILFWSSFAGLIYYFYRKFKNSDSANEKFDFDSTQSGKVERNPREPTLWSISQPSSKTRNESSGNLITGIAAGMLTDSLLNSRSNSYDKNSSSDNSRNSYVEPTYKSYTDSSGSAGGGSTSSWDDSSSSSNSSSSDSSSGSD